VWIVQVLSTKKTETRLYYQSNHFTLAPQKVNLTPLTTLTWAYQLHYYLCFRTHRRRELFSAQHFADSLAELIKRSRPITPIACSNRSSTQLNCDAY